MEQEEIFSFFVLLVFKRVQSKINCEIVDFKGVDNRVLSEKGKDSCEICVYRFVCSDKSKERFKFCLKTGVYQRDVQKSQRSKVLRELISQLRLIALKTKKNNPKI